MKVLIVYYSRTGNTKKVAEAMQEKLACDIEEIQGQKSYAGVFGWTMAGKEGSQKVAAKIKPTFKNPADYDLIIFGTPIWAWNISSPLRGYLLKNKSKFKKIAAFCTMGGNQGQSFEEIEKICQKTLEAKVAFVDKEVLAGKLDGIKSFVNLVDKK